MPRSRYSLHDSSDEEDSEGLEVATLSSPSKYSLDARKASREDNRAAADSTPEEMKVPAALTAEDQFLSSPTQFWSYIRNGEGTSPLRQVKLMEIRHRMEEKLASHVENEVKNQNGIRQFIDDEKKKIKSR